MKREEIYVFLSNLAEGIAETFGPNCETLIHDLSVPEHPILKICNNGVSGRKVGSTEDIYGGEFDPAMERPFIGSDYVNHLVITKKGKKVKTSTWVLNGDNYRFGFGVNYDFTDMEVVTRTLESFTRVNSDLEEAIAEDNKGNQLELKVKACVDAMGKPVEEMTKQDRLEVIRRLRGMNAFRFQKAVPYVAEKLGVSRYSVYKYLNEA
ncbi:MAG TPA: helix-turn-helix transcriptional regulator [Rectinemataceae bacterium]|nr:helix-turn-helix transcriptional regulator [Rectinemataceae bacterium]